MEATKFALQWCEHLNKRVYGTYKFLEHNLRPVSRFSQMDLNIEEKEVFKFKVNFRLHKRNERWIVFPDQSISAEKATEWCKNWCEEKNKVVNGTYTFLKHNVKDGRDLVEVKFKVHFRNH